ncbi:MAG: nucleoside triphosphate pyrophosphohydrolase [Bacillota bacterium]
MPHLYIVGLGRGDLSSIAAALEQKKLSGVRSFICTAVPPHLEEFLATIKDRHLINLEASCVGTEDLPFAERREKMVETILDVLKEEQAAALLLPGRPWPGEILGRLLRQRLNLRETNISYLTGEDVILPLLDSMQLATAGRCESVAAFSFCRGVTILDALCGEELKEPPRGELLISQVYSHSLLTKLVEQLGDIYPAGHHAALWQFDRHGETVLHGSWTLDELAVLSVLPLHGWSFLHLSPPPRCSLGDMTAIMAELRSPEGCPWDRQQDHRSLRPYLLEETYEVLEAINSGDTAGLCEELGDLLLQVIFHSELAREQGDFSLWEVIDGITRKIYRRHPHVFQQEKLADARAVSRCWQEIKLQEKGKEGVKDDFFALPPGLPALMKAQKIQKRAAAVGFDWPNIEGALEKVGEELRELKAARTGEEREKVEEEYGDLLFAMVNVARFLHVDAEQALAAAIQKFTRRFQYIKGKVEATGKDFTFFSLEELDHFWEEAKFQE